MPIQSPKFYIFIISLLCLISSVGRFVIDSYLPSLPSIQASLSLTDKSTQMTLTLYLLGFGLSQLIYGPLSDHFGRRKMLLTGIAIFLIGDIGCIIAHSGIFLLLSRLVAGMGAGACGVLNRAIASDCFKGPEFSKAWSYTTTALVITLILAPLIGGYAEEWMNWRANFSICAIYVGFVFFIILCLFPETNTQMKNSTLNIKNTLKNYGEIVSSYPFMISTLCYTLAFAGLIAYFQVSPLFFINQFDFSPSEYGWSSLAIAISYFSGGFLVRKLVFSLGTHCLLQIGIFILMLGGLIMLIGSTLFPTSWQIILISASVYVIGARIVIPNASAQALSNFHTKNGSTSAVIGCIQMLGAMFVSLAIAHFSIETATPLALFLTFMGVAAIVLFYSQYWNKFLSTIYFIQSLKSESSFL